jgi:hypothetical protein
MDESGAEAPGLEIGEVQGHRVLSRRGLAGLPLKK